MLIYKITNKLNGQIYVGQTIRTLEERWYEHCKNISECSALSQAIHKYGKESFVVEAIYAASSIEELNQKEQEFIKFYNTLRPNGYNLTSGGLNFERSVETRQKISLAQRGKKNHRFGKKASKATRRKMSEASKGLNNHFYGKTHSEKTKKLLSKKAKKQFKKRGHPRLGKTFSRASKKKMSLAQKGRPAQNRIKIRCIETGQVFDSMTHAAKAYGLDLSSIAKHLKHKQYKHVKGFTFSYI